MASVTPLILLAPSEDKAPGGVQGIWAESTAQTWVRERVQALARSGTEAACAKAFDVKGPALARALSEVAQLGPEAPLMAALERYRGVAFEGLEAASLPEACWRQVWILSNLRGLVRGDEPLPSYKLKLGGIPGLKAHWKAHLTAALGEMPAGEVWELLPKDHSELIMGWTRVRHTVSIQDARGRSLSHFSKKYRGLLARTLLLAGDGRPEAVLDLAVPGCRWEGHGLNQTGGAHLTLVVP